MPKGSSDISFDISAGGCILAATLLLLLPLPWVAAAATAALFHELCHGIAAILCNGNVRRIVIGSRGVVMEVEGLRPERELICALAGPLGGLVLLLWIRWIPRVAICALVQSIYNLLPVYPLDGGRALHCLVDLLFPRYSAAICKGIEGGSLAILLFLTVYGAFCLGLGLAPTVFILALWSKRKNTLQS